METLTYRVRHRSRKDKFKLYPLGDIHAGTVYCDEKAIQRKVKEIRSDPLALWIGMGDYADCITEKDKRWDNQAIADWVNKCNILRDQENWIINLFTPIKEKCIGLIEGNHEATMRMRFQNDFVGNVCTSLEVTNLRASVLINLIFQRYNDVSSFKCFFAHGSGAPNTDGGRINILTRKMMYYLCDVFGMGHLHDIITHEKPAMKMDESEPPRLKEVNRCAAITGSWFLSYKQGEMPSYAEQKGYPPNRIGCPVFVFHPDKWLVNVYANSDML